MNHIEHPSEVIFPYLSYSRVFYSAFEFVALSVAFIRGEKLLVRTVLS